MRKQIDKVVGGFLVILMAAMTLDVLWGVFTRYAMSNQASWSEELARFLLIWIGILGAAYASGQKMHLSIDLLKPKLDARGQKRLDLFINVLVVLFAVCILLIGGFRLIYVTQTLGQTSAALRFPMAAVYSVVPIAGALICYYKLSDIIQLRAENPEE